jgi:hypothetical protein
MKNAIVKMNTVLLLILVVLILFGLYLYALPKATNQGKSVACTMEAKICPDGSAVGRSGPKCEFESCPTSQPSLITIYCESDGCAAKQISIGAGMLIKTCHRDLKECQAATASSTDNTLKTFKDPRQNISYRYPELSTKFIHAQEWPPTVSIAAGKFNCSIATNTSASLPMTTKKMIGGQEYCITILSDAAAGTVYNTYNYLTELNGKLVTLKFILGEVQCLNYDNPQQAACLKERKAFNPDSLISQIIPTLEFNVN